MGTIILMHIRIGGRVLRIFASILTVAPLAAAAHTLPSGSVELAGGWQLQDAAKVPQTGAQVSSAGFNAAEWYAATVPGIPLQCIEFVLSQVAKTRPGIPTHPAIENSAHSYHEMVSALYRAMSPVWTA